MKSLPDGLQPYRETPVFSAETVPPGLTRDHSTKAGVWGVIHVLSGQVTYRIKASDEEIVLVPGKDGIVEPEALHSVALAHGATFRVVFWR